MISEREAVRIEGWVEEAVASGARVALTVRGPAGARAEFESLSIDPR